jgi:hypothetical protein
MRSAAQMRRRIHVDRANLQQGPVNFHYENMKTVESRLTIAAAALHYDDGRADLDPAMKFDWTSIYGRGPELPREVAESYLLSTKRWEIASLLKRSLARLPSVDVSLFGRARIDRWLDTLDDRISCPVLVALKKDDVKIVTPELAERWSASATSTDSAAADQTVPSPSRSATALLGTVPVSIEADTAERCVRVVATESADGIDAMAPPLVALVPCYGGDDVRVAELHHLRSMYYYLACEPQAALSC